MQGLTPSEMRTLRSLRTPYRIQKFLDGIRYNKADTAYSPRLVLRHRTAHCLEAAVLAAAALRVNGMPPLIFDLEAENDTDHVLCLFRERGAWGALALSNFSGLRFRAPIHKTLRELALSYFNDYVNYRGDRTLRNFSRPVDLTRFDQRNWMSQEKDVWFIAEHLCEIPHTPLLTPAMVKGLRRVDARSMRAAMLGARK